jgi:methionyl aminopeptidase
MVIISEEDLFFIKQSSLLVGKTLGEVAKQIRPGISSKMLDLIAEEFIRSNGGIPAFKGYRGFPATLCISLNDVVVHGIPGTNELREGDIVSVDCGVVMNGMYGDYAYTFILGEVDENIHELVSKTYESLYYGISTALAGNTTGHIGQAVQDYVEKFGFSVVRELVGHGIGRILHDKPEVPNYGKKGKGPRLEEGMAICIEPMINMGKKNVYQARDGWTIRTLDGKPSAHFEHMVIVGEKEPQVLSTYEYIEENINKNIWLSNRL